MNNNQVYHFFKNLDRSLFIDNEYKEYAKYNSALPIGYEQTISQPTLVYAMTSKLDLNSSLKVLEIGTGSGYQTAFLAEFSLEVYTVERISGLSERAKERLLQLGYNNVHFKIDDGSKGWPEHAPYDRIIATAAAGKVPEPLLEQLKNGGKMLIPVGQEGVQQLLMIKKDQDGKISEQNLGDVTFVEFKGEYGWEH